MSYKTMDKCFIIERISRGAGKYKMEFFGDQPFADARIAKVRAAKMTRARMSPDERVSVRAVAFGPK